MLNGAHILSTRVSWITLGVLYYIAELLHPEDCKMAGKPYRHSLDKVTDDQKVKALVVLQLIDNILQMNKVMTVSLCVSMTWSRKCIGYCKHTKQVTHTTSMTTASDVNDIRYGF